MRIKTTLTLFIIILLSQSIAAIDFTPVRQLISRRVPWLESRIEFKAMNQMEGKDAFELTQ